MNEHTILPDVKLAAPTMRIGGDAVALDAMAGGEMAFAGSGTRVTGHVIRGCDGAELAFTQQ